MTEVESRPRFYEGQYLAAADLTAGVDYTRTQRARLLLGGHRWGIALGLDLMEVPGPQGVLDVVLQPGYAWDGFGRPVVVGEPAKLATSLFTSFDALFSPGAPVPPPVAVEVWIRYDEALGGGPRPGFETCEQGAAYSRVTERYAIEAGPRPDVASRRDAIELAGRSIDASQALRAFDPAAPVIEDASVPHQVLPEEGEPALWLLPLGVVSYQPGDPGRLVARSAEVLARHRRSREYAGVVAGSVEASGGVVRVHDRAKPYSTFASDELLRVEGDVRADGDVRIYGRRLEFVSRAETTPLPVHVVRRDDAGAGTSALTLVIGDKEAGRNRLVVARQSGPDAYESQVVVTDQGRVGVGTEEPRAPLHLPEGGLQIGTGTSAADQEKNFALVSSDGGARGLRFLHRDATTGPALMTLTATGRLGVGATAPTHPLHVAGSLGIRQHSLYLSGNEAWSSLSFNAHHDEANTAWEFPEPSRPAVTLEMDAAGGRPRFQVWSTPSTSNVSWVQRFGIDGHSGNVGIGVGAPAERLHVDGDIRFRDMFALGAQRKLRVVWGAVDGAGARVVGDGFGSARATEGRYELAFAPPFFERPVLVASRVFGDVTVPAGPVDAGQTVLVDLVEPARALVATADGGGDPADGGFTFVAIGPAGP